MILGKSITIILLSPPSGVDSAAFIKNFIKNMELVRFEYQGMVGYINNLKSVGVIGNYDEGVKNPVNSDNESVARRFLEDCSNDGRFYGYAWVIENRGQFSPQFLEAIHRFARVNLKPQINHINWH